jgi:hypothetical protein
MFQYCRAWRWACDVASRHSRLISPPPSWMLGRLRYEAETSMAGLPWSPFSKMDTDQQETNPHHQVDEHLNLGIIDHSFHPCLGVWDANYPGARTCLFDWAMVQSFKGSPHGNTNARAVVGFGGGIPPRAIRVLNLVMSERNIQENPLTQLGMSEDTQFLCFGHPFPHSDHYLDPFWVSPFCLCHGQGIV